MVHSATGRHVTRKPVATRHVKKRDEREGLVEMKYVLILQVLTLTSIVQVLQTLGAARGLKNTKSLAQVFAALFQWEIILAVICLASAICIWLVVLYMMDVSKAFPFISLGFVVVLLSARFYLHEFIPWNRWLGVVFIVAGISLLAQT